MKREKWISCLVGALLAFCLSFGGVGCLVTGFELENGNLISLALACALFSAGSALCFRWKRGGVAVLCVLAVASGFLWRSGRLAADVSALLAEITARYHSAYGWATLGQRGESVDAALKVIGCLSAVCVSWTVCRRKTALVTALVSLLPLFACLVVTDTVPSVGYLFLLLWGLILLVLTGSLRQKEPAQANTLTAMAAIPTALALGLLFLAVPEKDYVNHVEEYGDLLMERVEEIPERIEDMYSDAVAGLDGTVQAQTVNLAQQGPRRLYTYPVMDVMAAESGKLYLREQDYDSYDGTGWTATVRRSEEFGAGDGVDWRNVGVVTIVTRNTRDVVCYPYYPGEPVTLVGGSVDNTSGTSVFEIMQCALPSGWRSALKTSKSEGVGNLLLGVGDAAPDNSQRWLNLPTDTKAWARELLEEILSDEDSTTEKAEAIAAYVRASADYSLNTARMPGGTEDFARWFLEESETGYCVHFATATAVLLRAAGIRSRYVTGYLTYGVAGQKVTVTADQAHAWVEYYEPALDVWIPLESTPGDGTAREPETESAASETSGAAQGTGPEETASSETEDTEGGTAAIGPSGGTDQGPEGKKIDLSWLAAVLRWVLGIGIPAGAVVLQRRIRLENRRKRRQRGRANARALAMWREAVLFGKVLGEEVPEELEILAEKAKYSQHVLSGEELDRFGTWLAEAQGRCRETAWYRRFVCRWVLALY